MILSRAWYVLLGLAVAAGLYVVSIAVGQYDRQGARSLKEGLASDSQTVEWELKIDSRRRLDALLAGSVDPRLQAALVAADAVKDGKIPEKVRSDAKAALSSVQGGMAADFREDALFAVDRDGHVVGQVGFRQAAGSDNFELGGYPVVFDALHGWSRDDVWLLGSKMYVVAARPVEYDATQRPAGAIVGLKEVDERFAGDLAKRTRTNIVFYAHGARVAGAAGVSGFEEEKLDAVGADLSKVDAKTYADGRSGVRMLTDDLGVLYARLPGEVWALGGGFAVLRAKTAIGGAMGFLNSADDKDKANVPWLTLVGIVLLAALVGAGLTLLEHTLPLRELAMQADRLKSGAMDALQVARFRGAYRLAAQSINQGIERSIEKAGGISRKPADLESILGPAPAQPAMSAFSFPLDGARAGAAPGPAAAVPPLGGPAPAAALPMGAPTLPGGAFHPAGGGPRPPAGVPLGAQAAAPPPALGIPSPAARPPAFAAAPGAPVGRPPPAAESSGGIEDEDEATMVGAVPAEVMAQAGGDAPGARDDAADWRSVYEDFVRTKKMCNEPIDGLTYEKFSHTLKKNRDALVQRHGCKRVKFSVYVKEGRASLKATPVKD